MTGAGHEIGAALRARANDLAARFSVTSLRLFGSHARGDAAADSDVDLIVAFSRPATFDAYMDLKFFLEDCLQRKVDLVTEKAIRPELRDRIEREAIRVA